MEGEYTIKKKNRRSISAGDKPINAEVNSNFQVDTINRNRNKRVEFLYQTITKNII